MLHTSGRDDCWDDRSNARPLCWARWKASTLFIHLRGPHVFEQREYIVPLNQKNPWSTTARGVRPRRRYNRLEFPGDGPIPDTVHSFCLGLVSIYHGKFSQRSVQRWQGEGASSVPEVFKLGMLARFEFRVLCPCRQGVCVAVGRSFAMRTLAYVDIETRSPQGCVTWSFE